MNSFSQFHEIEYRATGADPMTSLPHHGDSFELIQTWSDDGFFIVKNTIFPIKPGTVFLIDASNTHYSNPREPDNYIRSKVLMTGSLFRQISDLCGLEDTLHAQLREKGGIAFHFTPSGDTAQRVDQLFKTIKEVHRISGAPCYRLHLISALIQILEYLSHDSILTDASDERHPIDRMAKYINTHLNNWDDIHMTDICAALHISQSRAAHLFKELTGKPITKYVTDLRINEAKKLLLTTKMQIREISDTLKFQNATIFCKYFKKYVGCTPRQYRQYGHISMKAVID